jgi:hypothetical protein
LFDLLSKDEGAQMAASIAGASILSPAISATASPVDRKRRIDPQAGHALEILGHAIEYLADEFVHEGGSCCGHDPRVQAIQLLMARNRQVYFACPEVPNFAERCRAFFHRPAKPVQH